MFIRRIIGVGVASFIIVLIGLLTFSSSVEGSGFEQQPTVAMATVTSTPAGPVISVRPQEQEQINVRSGPGTTYPKIGLLLVGQDMPAKGRTTVGDWILIEYPGVEGGMAWVYAPLVDLRGGELPIVEPPPTPTPLYTPTIDPTLAARFIVTSVPTRLPTFTEPAPLVIPTMPAPAQTIELIGGLPSGLIIVILAAAGIFIGLFTLAQG